MAGVAKGNGRAAARSAARVTRHHEQQSGLSVFDGAIPGGDQRTPRYSVLDEAGAFGTKIFGGQLADEYNPELRGLRRWNTYEQMRRSDGQVRAVLNVLKLPIRAATWSVDAHDPDDEESVAQAAFVELLLMERMEQRWSDALREALLCVDFGFMVQEKVYEVRDFPDAPNVLAPKYLAFRHPTTIIRWNTNEATGQLESLTQQPPPSYRDRILPASKCLIYAPEQEGGNFEGISALRPMYKHWYIKEKLYLLQAIALARSGMGIPYIELPEGASDTDRAKARAMVETLTTSEQAGLTLPPGWKLQVLTLGQVADFQGAIDHHDLLMARSSLAQFLNLGAGNVGSHALSQDQSGLLLHALNALADHIADRVNVGLIREVVRLNYRAESITGYPKLAHTAIGERDLAKVAASLNQLGMGQFIKADDPLEEHLREAFRLPQADPFTARDNGMGGDTQPTGLAPSGPGGIPDGALVVGKDGGISTQGGPGGGAAAGTPAGGTAPSNVVAPPAPGGPMGGPMGGPAAPAASAPAQLAAGEVAGLLALADLGDALAFSLEDMTYAVAARRRRR